MSDPYVRAFFARFDQLGEDRQVTWRLPVLNKVTLTTLLPIPQVKRMLPERHPTFSFGQLLDHTSGAILLISLGVDRLHGAAHLNAVLSRVHQPESARVPVHLYIDEFETVGTDCFEAIIPEGRRFELGTPSGRFSSSHPSRQSEALVPQRSSGEPTSPQ